MSCPKTGTTFLFYDALDIPKPIVECLEDYSIAKIQSGIANDVKLFKECTGINVRGVVDSGTLFLMVAPDDDGYGAKAQLNRIYPKKTCHQEYTLIPGRLIFPEYLGTLSI